MNAYADEEEDVGVQTPCVTFAKPEPTTAIADAFLAHLNEIFSMDMGDYAQTVACVRDAFRVADESARNERSVLAREECVEALRWFWSSAADSRWKTRLFDGWQYDGPDWWAFNNTLMSAGARVSTDDDGTALRFLFRRHAPGRVFETYEPRKLGLSARGALGRDLLLECCERPDLVGLLLTRLGADPVWRSVSAHQDVDDSAYAQLRAGAGAHTDPRVLKTIELMETHLDLPPEERLTRATPLTPSGSLEGSLKRMSVES